MRLGPRHPRFHPVADEGTLELGQARHDGEDHLPLGSAGVDPLLVGDEVHSPALELLQGVDERLGGSGEAVIAPDQHRVHLPLPHCLEQPPVAAPFLSRAGRVIDELLHHLDLPDAGVVAQLHELGFWVLSGVVGRNPRIDGRPLLFGGVRHIKNEILFDNFKSQKKCLILKAFLPRFWTPFLITLR